MFPWMLNFQEPRWWSMQYITVAHLYSLPNNQINIKQHPRTNPGIAEPMERQGGAVFQLGRLEGSARKVHLTWVKGQCIPGQEVSQQVSSKPHHSKPVGDPEPDSGGRTGKCQHQDSLPSMPQQSRETFRLQLLELPHASAVPRAGVLLWQLDLYGASVWLGAGGRCHLEAGPPHALVQLQVGRDPPVMDLYMLWCKPMGNAEKPQQALAHTTHHHQDPNSAPSKLTDPYHLQQHQPTPTPPLQHSTRHEGPLGGNISTAPGKQPGSAAQEARDSAFSTWEQSSNFKKRKKG